MPVTNTSLHLRDGEAFKPTATRSAPYLWLEIGAGDDRVTMFFNSHEELKAFADALQRTARSPQKA